MTRSLIVSYLHLVWSTRDREPTLCAQHEPTILSSFAQTCEALGLELLAANGAWDHVHLLIRWSGHMSYDEAVCQLKSRAWRACHAQRAHDETLPPAPRWQRGYAAFSVREEGRGVVIRYIKRQKQHHRAPDTLIAALEQLCDEPSPHGRAGTNALKNAHMACAPKSGHT